MIGDDGARGRLERRRHLLAVARQTASGYGFARELVLIPLDLFLLTIHEPDVVVEEQVQVFMAVARQLLFDGLELKEQVEAECAYQTEAQILRPAELLNQRAENRKHRGLLA